MQKHKPISMLMINNNGEDRGFGAGKGDRARAGRRRRLLDAIAVTGLLTPACFAHQPDDATNARSNKLAGGGVGLTPTSSISSASGSLSFTICDK